MKPVVILALLCVSVSRAGAQSPDSAAASRPPSTQREALFGLDKPKHFLLSFFIESVSYATIQAGGGGRRTAVIGATATTTAFSVGREIHDRKTKGLFSFGDLLWDALGAGAAAMMLRHTYR